MVSRYINDGLARDGKILKTAGAVSRIRAAYRSGRIRVRKRILRESERIDQIAGEEFQNSTLWWIIAALSDIGWCLQAPPGTILLIPEDLEEILRFV